MGNGSYTSMVDCWPRVSSRRTSPLYIYWCDYIITWNVRIKYALAPVVRKRIEILHVTISNIAIDNVTQFKYQGVWQDPSLTWNVHIDKLVKNVNTRLGVLRRVRSVLPQNTLNLLNKTLILPHFDYCDAVWGNSAKVFLTKLDKIQNSAGRVTLGLPRRSPTDIILSTLGWQSLSERRDYHLTTLVYTSLTSKLPPQLCKCFHYVSNTYSYNTRSVSQGNLVPPLSKSNSGKRKFASRGVILFNGLPVTLKHPLPPTLASFKRHCKNLRF